MFLINNEVTHTSIIDITKDYLEFKGKRVKFHARVKLISLNSNMIIVEGHSDDSFIRIPKKMRSSLEELLEVHKRVDVGIIAEGVPYFCAHRGIVGIKQGKILAINPHQ